MTEPLTLPGTIPGLLRRGSPVFVHDRAAVVVDLWTNDLGPWVGFCFIDWDDEPAQDGCRADDECLALDLSDPTGRAHAAWWIDSADVGDMLASKEEAFALFCAMRGEDMPSNHVATLKNYALRLAEVAS